MKFYNDCSFALTFLSVVAAAFACIPPNSGTHVGTGVTSVACPYKKDNRRDVVATCSADKFYCDGARATGGKCIPLASTCDGEFDCEDETDEPSTCPRGRVAKSPKHRTTKTPRPSGGDGKHHVPCSFTCISSGYTRTCCAAHGLSGGKCVGEKAFCN